MQQMLDELKALPSKPLIYLCTPLQANHVTTNTEKQIRNDVIANEVIPMIRKVAKKNKDSYFRIDMLAATLFAIAKIDLLEGQNLVNALASGTFTF